jgi:hypothetical protein
MPGRLNQACRKEKKSFAESFLSMPGKGGSMVFFCAPIHKLSVFVYMLRVFVS